MELIAGAAELSGGIALTVATGGATSGLLASAFAKDAAGILMGVGVGSAMSGVGSMIQGEPVKGFATSTRNPISPWRVLNGRVRTGGSVTGQERC